MNLSVSNTGSIPFTLKGIEIPEGFSLLAQTYEPGEVILPGSSLVLSVEFTPTQEKGYASFITVEFEEKFEGNPVRVSVTGIGVAHAEPDPVDKTELEDILQIADSLDEEDYTPESWQDLVDAVAAGQAVKDDPDATQFEVDAAVSAITEAINALVPAEPKLFTVSTLSLGAYNNAAPPVEISPAPNNFSPGTSLSLSGATVQQVLDAISLETDSVSGIYPDGQAVALSGLEPWLYVASPLCAYDDGVTGQITPSMHAGANLLVAGPPERVLSDELSALTEGNQLYVTPYHFRGGMFRYSGFGMTGDSSSYSVLLPAVYVVECTSAPVPEPSLPTEIGQAFGGGYYIGDITVADGGPDDGTYAVIMAGPESEANLQVKTAATNTTGTDSIDNGSRNTLAMSDAGISLHPAAQHCLAFSGGGNEDWYMPALGELRLAADNLDSLAALGIAPTRYASSTQRTGGIGQSRARCIDFSVPGMADVDQHKNLLVMVRPVRRIRKEETPEEFPGVRIVYDRKLGGRYILTGTRYEWGGVAPSPEIATLEFNGPAEMKVEEAINYLDNFNSIALETAGFQAGDIVQILQPDSLNELVNEGTVITGYRVVRDWFGEEVDSIAEAVRRGYTVINVTTALLAFPPGHRDAPYASGMNVNAGANEASFGFPSFIFNITYPEPEPEPSLQIGDEYGGGIYIGDLVYPSGEYRLILGRDDSETQLAWKVDDTDSPGAYTYFDGTVDTQQVLMNGPQDHPAAFYCDNYSVDGFSDWFLPSWQELAVVLENEDELEIPLENVSGVYWTSAQSPGSTARAIVGSPWGGSNDTVDKVQVSKVRPMRRELKS